MAKHVMLFKPEQYVMWNGLNVRIDESADIIEAASRVFKATTSVDVQGWSRLAAIKDEPYFAALLALLEEL